MPTEITQNNNKIEIAQSNPIITVTDNNKGTSVDVTQVDITTVTVATPGPKGDRGPSGVVGDLDTLNIIGTITASGMSISGSIIPATASVFDLGSESKPFKDLFLHTGSLKFVKDGQVIGTIEGEDEGIKIGNIKITTASIETLSVSSCKISFL